MKGAVETRVAEAVGHRATKTAAGQWNTEWPKGQRWGGYVGKLKQREAGEA